MKTKKDSLIAGGFARPEYRKSQNIKNALYSTKTIAYQVSNLLRLNNKICAPQSGGAQNIIRTYLSSKPVKFFANQPKNIFHLVSASFSYPQKKKDSVPAVLIQLHWLEQFTNYPDYIVSASRLPNNIGLTPRLPDDIGLVQYFLSSIGGWDLNRINNIYSVQRHNIVNDVHEVQPFGFMPRACNSLRRTLFIQVARVESPSFFISFSSCSRNSGVRRIWYCGDLFSFSVDMVITLHYYDLHGNDHDTISCTIKAMPRSASTHTGHLTTNDKLRIEEAMKDHITPMTGRNSFTPNIKFLWRFFSCQQSKYFSVEASNEQEARSMLPDSPCLFSARIRQPSQNVVGVSA